MMTIDPRYRMRLRDNGFTENEPIPMDIFEYDARSLGTWDTLEKRWVKRNEKGEWVAEAAR